LGTYRSYKLNKTIISPKCNIEEFNNKTIVAAVKNESLPIDTYFICKLDIADF
jgi:hypothetical protein